MATNHRRGLGDLAGRRLVTLAAPIVSFADFKATHPAGMVLSRETGFSRDYGRNPYAGYDDVNSSPFLLNGTADKRVAPVERVVALELDGEAVAFPFRELVKVGVANESVAGTPVAVMHQGGTLSALDAASIPASRDVGAAGVFERVIDGRLLTFASHNGSFRDTETGSTWNLLGHATAGPLIGRRLRPVVHGNHFWFAWAVFKPETRIWTAQ